MWNQKSFSLILMAAFAALLFSFALPVLGANHPKHDRDMWMVYGRAGNFASPQLSYIVINTRKRGSLVKVKGTGTNTTTDGMFATKQIWSHYRDPYLSSYAPTDANSAALGTQSFPCPIADVTMVEGNTLVAMNCGYTSYILKVSGMGGVGENMFGVDFQQSDSPHYNQNLGWTPVTDKETYYLGDYHPGYRIKRMDYIDGKLLISADQGGISKFQGSGGTGHNMFGTNASSPGPNYQIGSQWAEGLTFEIVGYAKGDLFVQVHSSENNDEDIYSHLIKISGLGGTGQNMFNIRLNTATNQIVRSSNNWNNYLLGTQKGAFSERLTYVPGLNRTFINLEMGDWENGSEGLLMMEGNGGTGTDMFNVAEDGNGGFKTANPNYYSWLIGSQKGYFSFVREIGKFGTPTGSLVVGHGSDLVVLKSVATGNNMFAFNYTNGVTVQKPGYNTIRTVKHSDYASTVDAFQIGNKLLTSWYEPDRYYETEYQPHLTLWKYNISDFNKTGVQLFYDLSHEVPFTSNNGYY